MRNYVLWIMFAVGKTWQEIKYHLDLGSRSRKGHQKVSPRLIVTNITSLLQIVFHRDQQTVFGYYRPYGATWPIFSTFSNFSKVPTQTTFLSSLKRISEEMWLLQYLRLASVTLQEIEEIAYHERPLKSFPSPKLKCAKYQVSSRPT